MYRIRWTGFVVFIMISTALSGCLNSQNGPATPSNQYTEVDDAYGLWDPRVDGYVSLIPDTWGQTEWSDALEEQISFKEVTSGGALTQITHAATFHYKKVNWDPEDTLALAVDFDGASTSKSSGATPISVEVSVDTRVLTNSIVTSSTGGPILPTYVGSADDKLEAVFNPTTNDLVIESAMDYVFVNSNEINLGIKVIFDDGSEWTYSRISHFKYVVPINVPHNDLEIKDIEVVQAIQTEDNDITLVEGKDTMVRVFVDSTLMSTAHTVVTLEYCNLGLGIGCYDHMQKLHLAVQNPTREDITHSANFIIPEHWTWANTGIAMKASVEPYYPNGVMDYAEIDWDDNKLLDYNIQFHRTTDLTVWTVRVGQEIGSNIQHMPSFESELLMDFTEVLLPVSGIETVDFPDGAVPECPYNWGADPCMAEVEMWWRQITAPGTSPLPNADQIHAMTPDLQGVGAGFFDVGGLSAPAWAAGSIGWYSWIPSLHSARGVCGIHTLTCTAHEMTHNLGPHCWDAALPGVGIDCDDIDDEAWGNHLSVTGMGSTDPCHAYGVDPVWNAHLGIFNIKEIGWNPTTPNADSNQLAIVDSNYPDYMSYCQAHTSSGGNNNYRVPYLTYGDYRQWVSTHRWEWLFDKFDNWQEGNPAHPFNGRSEQSARMIVGSFENDGGGADLENSWVFDGHVDEQYRQYGQELGDEAKYTILAKDRDGGVVETIRFGISNITGHLHQNVSDHLEQSTKFVYSIQDDDGAIHSIEMYDNGELIDTLQSSNRDFGASIDYISEVSREQPLQIGWCVAENDDDVGNCDELFSSQIEYTWDGEFWMPLGSMKMQKNMSIDLADFPGGEDVQFRVRVTNGFDTATVLTDTYSLSNLAPEIVLDVTGPLEFSMGSRSLDIVVEIDDPEWEHIDCESLNGWLEGPGDVVTELWHRHDTTEGRAAHISKNCDLPLVVPKPVGHTHPHDHGETTHTHYHNHGAPINIGTIGFGLEPGEYTFRLEYVDSSGNVAEAEFRFTVTPPEYSSIPLEDFRELLIHIDEADELGLMYRS